MKRLTLTALAGAIVLGSYGLTTGAANADFNKKEALVCYAVYKDGYDTYNRLVLDIVKHSGLSQRHDYYNKQTAYTIAGKYVTDCDNDHYWDDMSAVDGTLITSENKRRDGYTATGTRLGVEAMGALNYCKNVKFDCTSADISIAPEEFETCAREVDGHVEYVTLKEVDRFDDYCKVFQDGYDDH